MNSFGQKTRFLTPAENIYENLRSTKNHTRLIALPNIARSCSTRTRTRTLTQFVVSVVPALHTRNYGRDAPVLGYAHEIPRLRILIIHRATSVARFKANLHLSSWELSPEPATFATSNKWSNKDMDPGECS